MTDTMAPALAVTLEDLMEKYNLPEAFKFDYANVAGEDFKNYRTHLKPRMSKKTAKSGHLEDVSTATDLDTLKKATVETLRTYCTDNGLKVGGQKKQIMERVWKHINGETDESDKSPKNRIKKVPEPKEKHACCGTTKAGEPCRSLASHDHERDGQKFYFCFRHEKDAEEIMDRLCNPSTPVMSDNEIEEASTPPPKPKRIVKKKKASPKKVEMEEEE